MTERDGSTGHEPAAPSLRERRSMIADQARGVRLVVGHRKGAERLEAGHAEGFPDLMTEQTAVVARELGFVGRLLRERVEDDALLRIEGGEFEGGSAAHPSDCQVIIEVERPGIASTDVVRL